MNARMFHVQLGQGKLGWAGKLVLGFIALVLIALLLMFGVIAVVVGGVALLALKVVRALKPASASGSAPVMSEEDLAWARRETGGIRESLESGSVVRDVEVEVLPADEERRAKGVEYEAGRTSDR